MVSNLIPMSYTEYHQYKQESLQDGETEWRHVRVANPVYYINPYFNTTQAQYSVSKHGQVITKAGELFKVHPHTRGKRVELFINGEKQFVFISKIMLDSFGDWDFERDYPYPIDNNYQSLEFSSWVQGTLKEARDHLIQYLETQNPGERFKPIGKLKHGVHDRYLVSSQGKVFSMWRNAFMALDTEDPYTSVHLQGKDYDLGRLVYGAFIGEIPIGYNVCRGYAGETYADQLRLSNTNEVRDEALKKASSTFNLTDIDEQAEVWKPMNRGRRIYRRLEGNVEVSSEGRVKINGSLLTQHKINGYLLIHYDGHYYFVHRMVAATFIPNPDPHKYKIVNHMSRDRTCNKIWNLEWVSASENSAHAWGIPIEVIDERDGNAESFLTLRAVCKRFKIGRATLVKRIEDGQLFRGYYRAVALKRQQSSKFVSQWRIQHKVACIQIHAVRKQDGAVHIAHQDNDEDSNQEQIENTGSTAQLSLEFDDDGEFDEIDSSDEECVFGSDVEETEGDHLVVEDVFEYRTQEEEKNSLYEENYQQDDSSSIDISQQIDIDAVAHYLGETSLYDEESMQLLEDMPVLAHDYSISYDDYRHSGEDDNSKENESESEDNKSSMDDSPNRISMNEDEEEDEEDTIRYKYKRHSIWDTSEDSGTDSEDKESTIVHVVDATVAVDIFSESEDNIGETINYKQKRNHSLDTSEESD